MKTEYIKSVTNLILGTIETNSNGDQIARIWPSRRIVGYYRAKRDITTDLLGRIISKGNSVVSLIYKEINEGKK